MTRAMLDIETLATTPDAAIVSIGAVTFSTDADPIGQELHISVSTESCREHGRRVDQDTLDWPDREHTGTEHNALDDARHQARCVAACLRRQQAVADGGASDD